MAQQGQSIITKVNELINPLTETWDEELVVELFDPEDAKVILAIPLKPDMEDFISWHHIRTGQLT